MKLLNREHIKYSHITIVLATLLTMVTILLSITNILQVQSECIYHILLIYAIVIYICLLISNFE